MSKSKQQGSIDVWVIEDNETLRQTVARVLGREKDMDCSHQFDRCEDAFTVLLEGARPQVILLDLGLARDEWCRGNQANQSEFAGHRDPGVFCVRRQ